MNRLIEIYKLLLKNFGKQGWWPLTLEGFESKHHSGRPLSDKHRFEIIIGAILTQNTNWKNVEKALFNLSKNDFIDAKKICKVNRKKLAQLIRPAGYYNQKAERLKIFGDYILKNYKGDINHFFNYKNDNRLIRKNILELRKELLSIKGIGPETADSIILYAAEKPIFVIDAYTKRIFERLGYKANSYDEWQKMFMDNLSEDREMFNEYHALLVELGKRNCKKKPVCEGCVIKNFCKKC